MAIIELNTIKLIKSNSIIILAGCYLLGLILPKNNTLQKKNIAKSLIMNFSLYIFGTSDKYNQYPADSNYQLFQDFYRTQKTDSQLVIYRSERLVYYSFTRRLSKGISDTYLGVCLVFNGIYCREQKKIYELFENSFSDIALKGELLQMDKGGKISFATDNIAKKQLEIERIRLFFLTQLENNFNKDFTTLSPSFKIGNGAKALSINDANSEILTAIQQFDRVFVSNNEKPNSELDRIHKMLSNLYTEKEDLSIKYKKLLGEKKQYKAVMLLCITVIGCILGLVIFNTNLQSKESQLKSLEIELTEKNDIISKQSFNIGKLQIEQSRKNDTISNQLSNIAQLQITQSQLKNEVYNLEETINQKNAIIDEKIADVQNFNNKISNLNSENISLRNDLKNSSNQNRRLSLEISNLKNSAIQKYKVNVSKSYCYRQCGGNYSRNDCYYGLGGIVDVYTQQDGYGLTLGGYLKMSDLQKY